MSALDRAVEALVSIYVGNQALEAEARAELQALRSSDCRAAWLSTLEDNGKLEAENAKLEAENAKLRAELAACLGGRK